MSPRTPDQTRPYDFYARQYQRFNAPLAAEIRTEIYGEDIGQQGWRSMREQDEIISLVTNTADFQIADIACGSAGPSLSIAANTPVRLTGVDIEDHAVAEADRRASELGCADRARFIAADCSATLPFEDDEFDLITCVDAILHLGDRAARLADWARTLKPGAILFLTDAAILTGAVSKAELDIRASQGGFTFVAPGVNEIAIANAGLQLVDTRDTTDEAADIARRTHTARARHAEQLIPEEGEDWFAARQQFLETTAELAASHRLSRFRYIARKAG